MLEAIADARSGAERVGGKKVSGLVEGVSSMVAREGKGLSVIWSTRRSGR